MNWRKESNSKCIILNSINDRLSISFMILWFHKFNWSAEKIMTLACSVCSGKSPRSAV